MLDVHILLMNYTAASIKEAAVDSCFLAAKAAGFPVEIHLTEGIVGHLGKARRKGYSLGNHPYVTYVDDDDFVAENAFAILEPFLQQGVNSITTGENHIYPDGKTLALPEMKHHLTVYKRDLVSQLSYDEFQMFPDHYILSMFDPEHISECVYNHRININSGSRIQRRENKERAREELSLINRPHLAIVENMSPLSIAVAGDKELWNTGE